MRNVPRSLRRSQALLLGCVVGNVAVCAMDLIIYVAHRHLFSLGLAAVNLLVAWYCRGAWRRARESERRLAEAEVRLMNMLDEQGWWR